MFDRADSPRRAVPKTPPSAELQVATVASLRGRRIRLRVGSDIGVLMVAGIAREALHDELIVGQQLPVRAMGVGGRGETNYSCKGLIRSPWERIAEEFSVGDIVRGRVVNVNETYALVDLLPEAAGLVPLKEIDFDATGPATRLLAVGEVVSAKILALSPELKRANLSIRQALGYPARDRIALVPGGRPFPRDAAEISAEQLQPEARNNPGPDRLAAENRKLHTELAAVRKALKAARAQADALSNESDSTAGASQSGRDFLRAVRVAYATDFDEEDRARYPLRRIQVGRNFLSRLRALEGVPIEKVVEVCAQVAAGRAKDLPSRRVHRAGDGGSGGVVRATDRARAWRCSLQDGTPGARRLHWWEVPTAGGGTVEFASVGHHDDYDVPE